MTPSDDLSRGRFMYYQLSANVSYKVSRDIFTCLIKIP